MTDIGAKSYIMNLPGKHSLFSIFLMSNDSYKSVTMNNENDIYKIQNKLKFGHVDIRILE